MAIKDGIQIDCVDAKIPQIIKLIENTLQVTTESTLLRVEVETLVIQHLPWLRLVPISCPRRNLPLLGIFMRP